MCAGKGSWEGRKAPVRGRKGKPGGGGAREAGGGDPRWRGPTDGAALTSMRLAGESPGTPPAARTSPRPAPAIGQPACGPRRDWLGGAGRGRAEEGGGGEARHVNKA